MPGVPSGSVVMNPAANAGDAGSILDLGRSHMPQGNRHNYRAMCSNHWSPRAVLCNKRRCRGEKPAHRDESVAPLNRNERTVLTPVKAPHSQNGN